ncbi:MAG TPA: response regulator [Ktedonobacteraceae bacterium]|jgi:CheY-like chemotaxis protein|nr:response regulator [Ktedonobacteraceae bacterium]
MSLLYRPASAVRELVRGEEQKEKTILVVEDDEELGELILEALYQAGRYTGTYYRILMAMDGLEALELSRHALPDLFLLDYFLPRMNGLDLYDRLQAIEQLHGVPTIFMSANPPLKELKRRNVLSLRKPFHLHELLYTIEWLLAGKNEA